MKVCIIGGGGQVAEGIAALLAQRGIQTFYYRPAWIDVPGIPRRPRRPDHRLVRTNTVSEPAASIESCATRYRWADESELRQCDIFIFSLPSYLAEPIGRQLAPFLAGRILVNVSDRFLGTYALAVEAHRVKACKLRLGIAFNSPPLLAYQPLRNEKTRIYYEKPFVVMGCFPRSGSQEAQQVVTYLFGVPEANIRVLPSVLHVAFENVNSILHAVQDLHNLRTGKYAKAGGLYTEDAYTEAIVDKIVDIVLERDAIAKRVVATRFRSLAEFDASTFIDADASRVASFGSAHYRHHHSLLETIPRPYCFSAHGYEDVGWSIVPLESAGAVVGVSSPALSRLIDEWSTYMAVPYRHVGRTLQSLGLLGSTDRSVPSDPLLWSWRYDAF